MSVFRKSVIAKNDMAMLAQSVGRKRLGSYIYPRRGHCECERAEEMRGISEADGTALNEQIARRAGAMTDLGDWRSNRNCKALESLEQLDEVRASELSWRCCRVSPTHVTVVYAFKLSYVFERSQTSTRRVEGSHIL